MRAIFRKRAKKGKISENLSENVENLKYFEKEQPYACDYRIHKTP